VTSVLYDVPAALFAEVGLDPGGARGEGAYRFDDPTAVLIPLDQIRAPAIGPGRRGYKVERLRPVLAAVAAG
jgi:hypothetical protein